MGKIWGGWGKGGEGDKVGLIQGGDRLTTTPGSSCRRMVGTPLIRSKNKELDQKYYECKQTRFMREGELVSMIGFQNAREPARQVSDYAQNGTFKNFMKMPHQILSDFAQILGQKHSMFLGFKYCVRRANMIIRGRCFPIM